jgi:hypothetical protein
MMSVEIDCMRCMHFNYSIKDSNAFATFPEDTPDEIIWGEVDPKKPYPGDNGTQFEAR